MKVLVLSKYGKLAASTRQRFLQYDSYLNYENICINICPLFNNEYLEAYFLSQEKLKKRILLSYLSRAFKLIGDTKSDAVIVHCEVFPYMPGFLDVISKRYRTPLVYDFDDAIFHQYDNHSNSLVRWLLGRKLEPLIKRADLALCGNEYLRRYAAQFCQNCVIVPTVLNTEHYIPSKSDTGSGRKTRIGWIGSPSTWGQVQTMLPTLHQFAKSSHVLVRVIGAGPKAKPLEGFEFFNWSEETEVSLLQGMDIGIMPLPDTPWARGKCGYKLIQYMACGLPVVASPVGVNRQIVEHGVNGFLAETEEEWRTALETLLADPDLRQRMGIAGRSKVEAEYSIQVHGPRVARMLRDLVKGSRNGVAR